MTSRIPSYAPQPAFVAAIAADPATRFSAARLVSYDAGVPLAPKGYYYSDTNYILAQMIIERVTHTTFADQLTRRIIIPLRLRSLCCAPYACPAADATRVLLHARSAPAAGQTHAPSEAGSPDTRTGVRPGGSGLRTAATGVPGPASAIPRLTAIAHRAAAINGDPGPAWITAVLTTRAKALTSATPRDYVPGSADVKVYLITMRGHFTATGATGPPGAKAPAGWPSQRR